jgi:hypothetical protein
MVQVEVMDDLLMQMKREQTQRSGGAGDSGDDSRKRKQSSAVESDSEASSGAGSSSDDEEDSSLLWSVARSSLGPQVGMMRLATDCSTGTFCCCRSPPADLLHVLTRSQNEHLPVLRRLCRRVFRQQAYWKPADRAPRNVFEHLADQIFRQHVSARKSDWASSDSSSSDDGEAAGGGGSGIDMSQSGTEWWVQIRGAKEKMGTSLGFHW